MVFKQKGWVSLLEGVQIEKRGEDRRNGKDGEGSWGSGTILDIVVENYIQSFVDDKELVKVVGKGSQR